MNGFDDVEVQSDMGGVEVKKLVLFKIASKLYSIIGLSATRLPAHTVRSCVNTISLCMFGTIMNSTNFDASFHNYLQLLAPDFVINEQFIKPTDSVVFVDSSKTPLGAHH